MTTREDKYDRRLAAKGPGQTTVGVSNDPNTDPTGQYPSPEYHNKTTVNKAAYGAETSNLDLGGNEFGVSSALPSSYGKNRIIATECGHTFEMDDTVGNQRILIKHKTGNGIEFKSDGSMVIAAGNQIISVSKDQQIIIEGNATIIYGGNVDMQVAGDFNLKVGGSYNVNVGENISTNTEGAMRTTVGNNVGLTVKGSKSETVIGSSTSTILGDNNTITKGVMRNTSQGNMQLSSGANTQISARDKFFQSSYNMNIAATDLSVFGVTGVIGGESIVGHMKTFYGTSATFTSGVTAPTFHGDLDGKASTAALADKATGADTAGALGSAGTAGSITNTATNTFTRTAPTGSLLNDYLYNTAVGAVKVQVDIDDHFLKSINKSATTGGLATRELSTAEYRSHLRQDYNLNNPTVVGNAVATGKLSPEYTKTTPDNIGRTSPKGNTNMRGENKVGAGFDGDAATKFKSPIDNTNAVFTPEIIIENTATVTNGTKLAEGITIATFTGCIGQLGNINKIPPLDRPQIARNLQPHAELLRRFRDNKDKDFKDLRLVPVEGIYNPTPSELREPSWNTTINYYRSKGRAVVYEIIDSKGELNATKAFDFAVKLKNTSTFEKIIIDYDHFDPSGNLNTQIILIMPNLDENYDVTEGRFIKEVETKYNSKTMSNSDLIEVKTKEQAAPTPPPAPLIIKQPFVSKYDKYKSPIWTYKTQDKYFDDYINKTGPFANPSPDKDGSAKYVFYRANWDGGNIRIHVSERATLADQYGAETYGWSPSMTISGYEKRYNAKVSQQLKDLDNIVRLE